MATTRSELSRLKNLGPVSAGWLHAIGVYTEADLRDLGPVEAYGQITALFPGTSLNLLYALHGALENQHWAQLPEEVKAKLRSEARD